METYRGVVTFVAIGLLIWLIHERENNKKYKQKIKQQKKEIDRLYDSLRKARQAYRDLQQQTVSKSKYHQLKNECELLTNQVKKYLENI